MCKLLVDSRNMYSNHVMCVSNDREALLIEIFSFSIYITHFTVPVKTISLQPDHNPLQIIEGSMKRVGCVVNEDAAPPPVFTWYLKYNGKERIIERNTSFLNITGNRTDNSKTLECQSTNNNETPKTASTLLNIECKYM